MAIWLIDTNLNLVELNKANKVWSETIELTLLNSWTGSLYAEINDLGQVHVWGNITAGPVEPSPNISQLPAIYAPKQFVTVRAFDLTYSKNVLLGHINNAGTFQAIRNYLTL